MWRVLLALIPLGVAPWLVSLEDEGEAAVKTALETITEEELMTHLVELASPHLEGRDSPSEGLERAAEYIASRFLEAGLTGPNGAESFLVPFSLRRSAPDAAACSLELDLGDGATTSWKLEEDFTPLPGCFGEARGEPVFLGFGISGARRYDDLRRGGIEGKVAVVLEGEPRHPKLLEGPEITEAADAYAKVKALEKKGAVGVLLVRRPPAEEAVGADGEPIPPPTVRYRHTWARWNPAFGAKTSARPPGFDLPVLEVSLDVASAILGEDLGELAGEIDKSGKPQRRGREGAQVALSSGSAEREVNVSNVVGVLKGRDPVLASEVVVLGAHYDHIGVDHWGRVACGADDNASGTAALIELAQAFQISPPRRSIVIAAFAAEEDGLIGSEAFCQDATVPRDRMVAMLNMDMIGYGKASEVVVLGCHANPDLEKVLKRAKKLAPTKIKKVITNKARHLWERSDHYSFHEVGVPSLFFFEAATESDNEYYHTFGDIIERVNVDKMARTTRFVFNTAWLIANDDARPSSPE